MSKQELLGIIGVLAVILILILFLITKQKKEGFENADPVDENLSTIFTMSDSFTKFIKDSLLVGTKNANVRVKINPIPGWFNQNEACFAATEPRFMPDRNEQTGSGCGWWYLDDEEGVENTSFSITGSKNAPLNMTELRDKFPKGKWIWDIQTAQQMEEIKICKRLSVCEIADLMPGRCGFCSSSNKGVPINADGTPIYTANSPNGCSGQVVTTFHNCPKRLFVRPICAPDEDTGKLSSTCLIRIARALGCTDKGVIIKILIGDKQKFLKTNPTPHRNKFLLAKQQLAVYENIDSKPAYFGDGICSRYDAMYYYNSVKNVMYNSENEDSRGAAAYLVNGGVYNECNIPPNAKGPFDLHCIQREALINNFHKEGAYYPKIQSDLIKFQGMNWGTIQEIFKAKPKDLYSNNQYLKTQAYRDVIGLNLYQSEEDILREIGQITGLSYYIYEWLESQQVSSSFGTPKYTYFGREVKNTFPDFDKDKYRLENHCKKVKTTKTQIRFKANLVLEDNVDSKFWTYTDDGISIKLNGTSVLNKWYEQEKPVSYESQPFKINFKDGPQKLEVNWFNNAVDYAFVIRMFLKDKFHPIPAKLIYQIQPVKFPIARWDFYHGTSQDRCETLNSELFGSLQISTIDGKRCAVFNGKDNYIRINNGIHINGFKSITMMVNLQKDPYGPFRFWEFSNIRQKNVNTNNKTCPFSLKVVEELYSSIGSDLKSLDYHCHKNKIGHKISSQSALTPNYWTHLAWVIDENLGGMTMYLDGTQIGNIKAPIRELDDKVFEYMYILHGNESYDKEIAVAWFRIFDYSMDEYQVNLDKNNKFSMKLSHSAENTGWS